jgi:hypothetical protein
MRRRRDVKQALHCKHVDKVCCAAKAVRHRRLELSWPDTQGFEDHWIHALRARLQRCSQTDPVFIRGARESIRELSADTVH